MHGRARAVALVAWLVGVGCGSVVADDQDGDGETGTDDGTGESGADGDGEVLPDVLEDGAVDAVDEDGRPDVTDAGEVDGPPDVVDTPPDTPPVCSPGLTDCNPDPGALGCVDLESDPAHCGGCGQACGDPRSICDEGDCLCPDGYEDCDPDPPALCVQSTWFAWDPLHCGGCGNPCRPGQYCYEGRCECIWFLANCGGSCTDPRTDPRYCGGCAAEHECPASAAYCGEATCRASCSGLTEVRMCGHACVRVERDPLNCGDCGVECRADQLCLGGTCTDYTVAQGCVDCPCGCPTGTICCAFPRWGEAPQLPLICVEGTTCPARTP